MTDVNENVNPETGGVYLPQEVPMVSIVECYTCGVRAPALIDPRISGSLYADGKSFTREEWVWLRGFFEASLFGNVARAFWDDELASRWPIKCKLCNSRSAPKSSSWMGNAFYDGH